MGRRSKIKRKLLTVNCTIQKTARNRFIVNPYNTRLLPSYTNLEQTPDHSRQCPARRWTLCLLPLLSIHGGGAPLRLEVTLGLTRWVPVIFWRVSASSKNLKTLEACLDLRWGSMTEADPLCTFFCGGRRRIVLAKNVIGPAIENGGESTGQTQSVGRLTRVPRSSPVRPDPPGSPRALLGSRPFLHTPRTRSSRHVFAEKGRSRWENNKVSR